MIPFSALTLFRQALKGQPWAAHWPEVDPETRYDVVVVGGGGHGLATAYYLARNHGITKVAVLEAGWLGGGNTGRNTTVVRSNYFYPESARLYDFSLRLYEDLAAELNFNIMLSQRGMLTLAHSRHDLDLAAKCYNAMRFNGIDAELLDRAGVERIEPRLNLSPQARFPILGGVLQRRGGTARHDAVAWGYARAAAARGVHLIQQCRVVGFVDDGPRIGGVEVLYRGEARTIRADRIAIAVAGSSSRLAALAGLRLPVTSHALQAMVSEPVKPCLNAVTLSPAVGGYWSQSDKGEIVIGGALDLFPSYAQRGSFAVAQQVLAGTLEMLPSLSRLRLMRQWAGTVDVVADSSPIIGPLPRPGLYISCGWGTGGFKAIPVGGWTLAHAVATGRTHELAEPFQLERFRTGQLIDEAAAAGIAH